MLDRDEQSFFLWTEGLTPDIRHDGSGGLKNSLFYHRNFLNLSIHMRRSIGASGFGADHTHTGDIARQSKQLLREKLRDKADR
jgi:hypothetical protein